MKMGKRKKNKVEYGDFQTPKELAKKICLLLSHLGVSPSSILEPNCGKGNLWRAAIEEFPHVKQAVGIEFRKDYVDELQSLVQRTKCRGIDASITSGDFFKIEWHTILESLEDPILIIGNPPWVTNSKLGILGSSNLPVKTNFQNDKGLDAITGKSNFDISEWMLIQELEWIGARQGTLAMLCKTSVARKALRYAWSNGIHIGRSALFRINTEKHFGATVAACLLVVDSRFNKTAFECDVYDSLESGVKVDTFGYRGKQLVTNVFKYDRLKHLHGKDRYGWRSGVKHDCAKVMELHEKNGVCRNGLGEICEIEEDYLYPMLKSSDLSGRRELRADRWMLVPQRHIGEDTRLIKKLAPKTWEYLSKHGELLDSRSSLIYRNRPRFSIFGVGDYTFANWKVAISGLYKKLVFNVVGPLRGKPIVFDDTCYFLPLSSKEEALLLSKLLNSDIAKDFLRTFIFWDAKRPITLNVLKQLDVLKLAHEMSMGEELRNFLTEYQQLIGELPLFSQKVVR